jgi:transposase
MGWRRGQAYSQDLRDRVLACDGLSAAAVAERFGVSISYVIKARGRRDRLGDVAAGRQTSHTPAKLDGHDDVVQARVLQFPDATLAEHCAWARAELGIPRSITAMWKRLRKLKLTLKKSAWSPLSKRALPSSKHAGCGTN